MNTQSLCPCQSGLPYANCCEPLHKNEQPAESAEELMRSRFSAYSIHHIDYLIKTSCEASERDRQSIEDWAKQCQWGHLTILDTEKGTKTDSKGVVEFAAWYRDNEGTLQCHQERSTFIKANGHWLYDSAIESKVKRPKISRNQPCPCGSGNKFKNCCVSRVGEC